jgi:hypothetical protein
MRQHRLTPWPGVADVNFRRVRLGGCVVPPQYSSIVRVGYAIEARCNDTDPADGPHRPTGRVALRD